MDIDLARHIIRVALQNSRELTDLLQLLKQQLEPHEYKQYARGIAETIDVTNQKLTAQALAAFPELSHEMEHKLAKYSRFI
jgi:hypothetical protein